jgi:hypothetical protein
MKAYTLVDKETGEQWKHSKRLTYDTIEGLKMGYASGRWMRARGLDYWKDPTPIFPGPFKIVELTP